VVPDERCGTAPEERRRCGSGRAVRSRLLGLGPARDPKRCAFNLRARQPRATQLEGAHHGIHGGSTRGGFAEPGEDLRLGASPHQEGVERAGDDQAIDQVEDQQRGPRAGRREESGKKGQRKHDEHDRQHELAEVPPGIHRVADEALDRALVASGERRLVTGQQRGALLGTGHPRSITGLARCRLAVLGHQGALVGTLLLPPGRCAAVLRTGPLGVRDRRW
jgi:hypothetical protein